MTAYLAQSESAGEIKVGMGATLNGYTDRYPCTVIEVSKSGKTIKLREDRAVRTDKNGMSESQSYLFLPDPEGKVYTARLTKNGWVAERYYRVSMGIRRKYHDFSF